MIDEWEVWACANMLLKQHGADAHHIALERAQALGARGERGGEHVFRRIADRIEQLVVLDPTGEVH